MTHISLSINLKIYSKIKKTFNILKRTMNEAEQEKIENMANKSLKELAASDLNH